MDLLGKRFGRWLVIGRALNRGKRVYWHCRCACGVERDVLEQNLLNGRSRSCGCLSRELAAVRMKRQATKHGGARTRPYRIWHKMIGRCNAKQGREFRNYSGRGIHVCEEWKDFTVFQDWSLKNGYSDDREIDRINNDKGYSPGNCRWATRTQQVRNRRNTAKETINGETKSVAEWCEIFGYPYYIGQSRHQRGIPLNSAYRPKNIHPEKRR